MKGNFTPRAGLKFFSRQVRDYLYYFLGEANDSNLADLFTRNGIKLYNLFRRRNIEHIEYMVT